ncbi:hypothetical protein [Methylococcus geothermalis]|uniref:Uncharacterized protein n=1 Tax=Methylococcus geothermalis TaxID=2681310 RepID=A0A858Q831_9GAMM|nr:hypothetical protein [Methylococcus geothermalis]QJD30009.1 hypothetical protein GNH96_08520 [Methylococcus geothermalis]
MTELLFVFTVVFVGYVLYEVFKTVSRPASTAETHVACAPEVTVAKPAETPAEAVAEPAAEEPAEAAATPEKTPAVEEAAAEAEEKAVSLRNPATGEIAPVPTNYRFAKKWIKEALVAEGLLDRVYKNAELKGDTVQKVKDALERFKGLAKYQG